MTVVTTTVVSAVDLGPIWGVAGGLDWEGIHIDTYVGGWLVWVGLARLGEMGVLEPVFHGTGIDGGRFDLDVMATVGDLYYSSVC